MRSGDRLAPLAQSPKERSASSVRDTVAWRQPALKTPRGNTTVDARDDSRMAETADTIEVNLWRQPYFRSVSRLGPQPTAPDDLGTIVVLLGS